MTASGTEQQLWNAASARGHLSAGLAAPSSRLGARAHARRDDLVAVGILLVVALLFTWRVSGNIYAFVRGDWPYFFLPVYAYLGARLRALDIPGWNPHQFSGVPFAGDPESGWGYLPAMASYTLFPAEQATLIFVGFHLIFAALTCYVLARLLGLNVAGGFVAGATYALSWVATANGQLVIWSPVTSWMLVALIGVELAVKTALWGRRIWGWLVSGIAISQLLAVWLGQGSLYALLAIGAWIFFRTLIAPPRPLPWRSRLVSLLLTGAATGVIALGLSAAALLPRLDVISRSNLAGAAYEHASAWADAQTGFSPAQLLYEVLGGQTGSLWWYAGMVATVLALLAPVVALRWPPWPFFAVVGIAALCLALDQQTAVHTLTYALLPRFAQIHEHAPERVLILVSPCIALLAGATVSGLPRWLGSPFLLAGLAVLPGAAALAFARASTPYNAILSRESVILTGATSALIAAYALLHRPHPRQTVLLGLLLLTVWDPAGRLLLRGFVDETKLESSLQTAFAEQTHTFLHDNEPAAFLTAQAAQQPSRYAGFAPESLPDPETFATTSPPIGYRGWQRDGGRKANQLLVYNWGTWFGIDDIQGYNPVQVERYVEYVDALNGHVQEYHERDLYPGGLTSPLLDLLNLRFLVTPAEEPGKIAKIWSPAEFPIRYEDQNVRIQENLAALPRAWLVHEAQQVAAPDGLAMLASGAINPRQTALLEAPLPRLELVEDPGGERATYVRYEPDRIDLQVTAQAPALLMLSEVWDPGWSATVDGHPAPVMLADHVLRAVPVPAGEHTVILRYDPPWLRLGLAITALTAVVGVAAAVALGTREIAAGSERGNRS